METLLICYRLLTQSENQVGFNDMTACVDCSREAERFEDGIHAKYMTKIDDKSKKLFEDYKPKWAYGDRLRESARYVAAYDDSYHFSL